jgi:hypothetical protein
MSETTEGNVTMHIEDKVYLVAMTLISTAIIYLAWGYDAPMGDFALTFGGMLLGHVLTIVLDDREADE